MRGGASRGHLGDGGGISALGPQPGFQVGIRACCAGLCSGILMGYRAGEPASLLCEVICCVDLVVNLCEVICCADLCEVTCCVDLVVVVAVDGRMSPGCLTGLWRLTGHVLPSGQLICAVVGL